ncbi:MAG: hypothetical protein IK068_00740, partial [Lachnospiraceae bacterium]|nr:hypothetical protein [Lachnospiraceae bacterium]
EREKKDAVKLFDYIENNKTETYIFYESPRRVKDTFALISEALPEAKIALCNDLTKIHERIYRGTAKEILNELDANPNAEKGEYAFCMYVEAKEKVKDESALSLEAMLVDTMIKSGCSLKDAISTLANDKSVDAGKKEIYQASLNLKDLF